MLKRAMKGQFALLPLAETVAAALAKGEVPRITAELLGREKRIAELNKYLAVYPLKVAVETYGPAITDRQEILGAIADATMEAFAVDSAVARALQQAEAGGLDPVAEAAVKLYALEAHERAYSAAKKALRAAVPDAETCREHLAAIRKLYDEGPADVVGLRETIVEKALELGRYPLGWA
jgi:hypothetical protein